MFFSSSLRTRLSLTFASLIIVLITILSIAIGQRSIEQVRTEIGNSLGEIAYLMADKLDHYMWSRYGEIYILSELKEIREPENLDNVRDLIDRLKMTFPSFAWIGFTDKDGTVIASTDGILEGLDISARPVYLEALEETFIGDVHEAVLLANLLPNPSGEEMKFVDISTPIYDLDNRFIGVLAAHLSWEWAKELEESIMIPLKNRHNIEMYIVSSIDDTVLLGPREELGQPLKLNSIDRARSGGNDWQLETWPDGNQYLTGYVYADGYKDYPGLGWTVLVRQPVEVAYAPAKELLSYILMFGVMLTILLAIIGWIVADKIARPLKQITLAANRLRAGEKVEIPQLKGISEIEILSSSLKKLVDNLTTTEHALEEMEDIAHRDHLTGLPNRIALDLYLEKSLKKYEAITVLYLDLDGFKAVNDTLGHQAGDKLLVEVAIRLKENVRSEELVTRIGGDEFVIVLTNDNEPMENGTLVGERIISAINKPFHIDGEIVSVGCSVGGAVWPTGSENITEVIRLADQALYKVKNSGKNQVYFY